MKKIFFILFLLPVIASGQTETKNYVKTATYRQATTTGGSGLVNITYYDGLGRPIQQVASKASPSNKDIVTHIEYDKYSRQPKQYLPYAATTATSLYDPDAKAKTQAFYNTTKYENTLNPFSETFYEPSPLNRVLKQGSPGNDWAGNPDVYNVNDHTVRFDYQTNKLGEVRKFTVNFPQAGNTEITELKANGYHAANQLFKTITKDENWTPADGKSKTTEEFKDKAGRLILKRNYVKNTAGNDDRLDSYYVYDRYSNLTYVIPPQASYQIVKEVLVLRAGTVNFPWVKLVKVSAGMAANYISDINHYENEDILNVDLMDEYGGKGGFSVSANENGDITLDINITTTQPMLYTQGTIASLDAIGEFDDKELGIISGSGYSYSFLIRNNAIVVSGGGKVPSLVTTLHSSNKSVYFKNYPWTDICIADAKVAEKYVADIKNLDNTEILNTYTANDYGAMGGFSVGLSDDDNLILSLNISANVDMQLISGAIFTLDIDRSLQDMTLGTVSGDGYSYQFDVIKNVLYVSGSGKFRSINFLGSRVPFTSNIIKTEVENLCYIYHYDKRNRVVEKHIPDNGWTYIVYDQRDRPVYTQDENQRIIKSSGGSRPYDYTIWTFTAYDEFDRVAYTTLQRVLVAENVATQRSGLQSSSNSTLLDNRRFSVKRSTSPFTNGNDGVAVFYTQFYTFNFDPDQNPMNYITSVNYYDDYTPFSSENMVPETTNSVGAIILLTAKGLATGGKVRVLDATPAKWITTVTGYDAKARPVWVAGKNDYLGTEDRTETLPLFSGEIYRSVRKHIKTGHPTVNVYDAYAYDTMGRLLRHTQGQEPLWGWDLGPSHLIAKNVYDELGQLITKKVGNDENSPYQQVDYKYNIRGWLKQISSPVSSVNEFLNFTIGYDGLYNGNIAYISWSTANDPKGGSRSYTYTYDGINRLTDAKFQGLALSNENYSEGPITYDKNGNIMSLERWGYLSFNNYNLIDKLAYAYKPYSNQLLTVSDNSGSPMGFADNYSSGGNDYDYDANGNMVKDQNKNIGMVAAEEITYNHLNLPVDVIKSADHKIKFVYDASGQKLEKRFTNGTGNVQITQYANGFVYQDNVLQYYPHEEGYVRQESNGDFTYVYQCKDHLGNVRLSYADSDGDGVITKAELIEESNYYPFGMQHTGYNSGTLSSNLGQKIKYNGKELQEELNLGIYDYGARNYDPAIGRWFNVDPLAEKFYSISPFIYAANNPVFFVDPDGNQTLPVSDDIITKVSSSKGDKNTVQRTVSMTMTLAVVNPKGVDLSQTIFNRSSGTAQLSGFSGLAQKQIGNKMANDGLQITVKYRVVKSYDEVGKDEHAMVLVGNIPKTFGKNAVDPVGLAEVNGRVAAVETGELKSSSGFNHTAWHEIGHLLGLEHLSGGLMAEAGSSSKSVNNQQRGEIVDGQISITEGNGTYQQSKRGNSYKKSIKQQIEQFIRSNGIK